MLRRIVEWETKTRDEATVAKDRKTTTFAIIWVNEVPLLWWFHILILGFLIDNGGVLLVIIFIFMNMRRMLS